MEKRSICLTITQIRSHVNFGNNLRETIAKKVRFNFVTLKLHRSTCYVNWVILIGDLVDVTTLLLRQTASFMCLCSPINTPLQNLIITGNGVIRV